MNEIRVSISFTNQTCDIEGVNLITGDYNSTKIVFSFDKEAGTKLFKMKNPNDETIFVKEIENNEVVLVGETSGGESASLFQSEGDYPFEVALYDGDSRLTSVSDVLSIMQEQIVIDEDRIIDVYKPVFDQMFSELNTALEEVDNVDIDITTEGDNTKVVITRKDGTEKEAIVSGGAGTITDVEVDGRSVVTDGVANIDLTGKQDVLVSGENIKTINGQDITGSGNITIESGTGDVADVYYDDESVLDNNNIAQLYSEIYVGDTAPTKSQKIWIDTTEDDVALKDLQDDTTHRLVTDTEKTTWSGKQDALVSGTNIKTINNQSLLGSGNITIQGGGGGTSDYDQLSNRPSINSVTLTGNKSLNDLGIQPAGNYLTSETDPVFSASAASGITSSDITNWNNKGTYSKPSGGIPATDLASAVQTSLGKADTALQTEQYTGTITGITMNGTSKGTSGVVDLGTVVTDKSDKQDTLVSGTNIKTINSTSLLGSGNITTETIQYSTIPTADATTYGQIIQYIGDTVYDGGGNVQYQKGMFYECTRDETTFGDNVFYSYYWLPTQVSKDIDVEHPLKVVSYNSFGVYSEIASSLTPFSNNESDVYVCIKDNKKYIATELVIPSELGANSKVVFTSLGESTNNIVTLESDGTWGTSTLELQEKLTSGTNIKTINNQSILGSGNITISGGGGTATDVQVNGVSIVSNDVANLLTKTAYDAETNKLATESDLFSGDYDDLTDKPKINNIPISGNKTPQMYGIQPAGNYATDPSITTNQINATQTFTLNNNTEYRNTLDMTSITLNLPATIDTNYCSWLVFPSGSTATSLSYPNTIIWSGDDVSNNAFVPVSDKTYNVCFWYDSLNVNAVVRGA